MRAGQARAVKQFSTMITLPAGFFYTAALPNKQRRSTKEQLQAHDEVGGSCSAPKTSALPKPVLRLRGSDAPLWPHRSAPLAQQRQVAPEARAALLPRGGGAFTRISTLFSVGHNPP